MIIERLETAEEIARLLPVQDDVELFFSCSHSEWVQWLVSQAENPNQAIWANMDEEKNITSYIVIQAVVGALSKHLFVLYASSDLGFEENRKALIEIKKWGHKLGATKIRILADRPQVFHKYGFKEIATVMELDIDKAIV